MTGLLVVLPIADTVLWHVAVGRLQNGFDAWAADSRQSNLIVTRGKTVAGGWPFLATLRIEDVTVTGRETQAPVERTWSAPGVLLRLSPLHLRGIDIEILGEQRLRVSGMPDLVMTAARLLAVADMGAGDRPGRVDILAEKPHVSYGPGWRASAERIAVHVDVAAAGPALGPSGAEARKFAFEAEDVSLPASVRWPLGSTVAKLAIDGTLEGALPPALPPALPLAAWAEAWRDGGGSLQLRNVTLNWGPLNLTASATLALDDQLQPMGAGTSRVAGYAATLDALASGGALTRSAATAAKAVLSLLAGTPGSSTTDDVDVPLTLQFRTLSMRQVPLLRLPEIEWR